MTASVRVLAPAKVNLHLAVGAARSDGYHAVDTVLHTLALADEVIVTPSEHMALRCEPSVGVAPERNLAWKAAVAFGERVGMPATVDIQITKRIPHGAGLGGGSSDAAAVLSALAHLNGIECTDPRCIDAARCLGADVAFFLHGSAALLTGRGDELVRMLPPLEAPVVLVRPPSPVSTAAAYAAFDAAPQPAVPNDDLIAALTAGDRRAVAARLFNNLEVASSTVVPDVALALAWIRAQDGVLGALLAGSGSAVFGFVADETAGRKIAEDARAQGWWSQTTNLSTSGMTQIAEEG